MNVSSKAGQKALVKCTSKFGNPPATIKWLLGKFRPMLCPCKDVWIEIMHAIFNPLPPSDVRQQKKNIFEDIFSSVLSQFKKYHPSGYLKINNLGIFQSLKLPISMKKNHFDFS